MPKFFMRTIVFTLCVFHWYFTALAQSYSFGNSQELIHDELILPPVVKQTRPPEFTGGTKALSDYIKQTTSYPQRALLEKLEGTVYVEVRVMTDGKIVPLQVIGRIGGGCEEEALRIIARMPPWQPALAESRPVACKLRIPVIFRL